MASINFRYVDELIALREAQHGGMRGAPLVEDGHRIGASINRSCIVMLSALMQAYVEEVFQVAARRALPSLNADPETFDDYWAQVRRWGNPSASNIKTLFLRLGVKDVLHGLSWQKMPTVALRKKLEALNQIRNDIAHGKEQITVNGVPFSLTLAKVRAFRRVAQSFSERFDTHVATFIPRRRRRFRRRGRLAA